MVNIYRLIRIGIPDEDLHAFAGDEEGGPYQAVQVLLAVLTGSSSVAAEVFYALLDAPPADSVLSVLQEMQQGRTSQELRGGPTSQRQLSWIESVMIKLEAEAGLSLTAGDCQHEKLLPRGLSAVRRQTWPRPGLR